MGTIGPREGHKRDTRGTQGGPTRDTRGTQEGHKEGRYKGHRKDTGVHTPDTRGAQYGHKRDTGGTQEGAICPNLSEFVRTCPGSLPLESACVRCCENVPFA